MTDLRRCTRCTIPETHETIVFAAEGVPATSAGSRYKRTYRWQVASASSIGY